MMKVNQMRKWERKGARPSVNFDGEWLAIRLRT